MYLMLFKYLKGCNLVVSKFYFLPKCIWLKLQGLFAGSQKKKELCLREYKRKTGVKNITHYKLFLLSNCIQLTSNSIIPFCASRFMFAIRFCINVSLKSRYINEIFPRSCEGYIFWSEPFIHVNDAFICKIHAIEFRILSKKV